MRHQEACESLAETLEHAGRLDLAALCDRASYWLDPTSRVEDLPFLEVVRSCEETASRLNPADLAEVIVQSVMTLEDTVTSAASPTTAAKLQALAILVARLFHGNP